MAERSKLVRVVRMILVVTLVLLALFLLAARRFGEYYSSGHFGNTSATARERDVLVHVPAVGDSLVAGTDPPMRLTEIWIQADHRIEHPLILGTRIVRKGTFTLEVETTGRTAELAVIAHTKPGGSPDTLREWQTAGSRARFKIVPPFPDSIVVIRAPR